MPIMAFFLVSGGAIIVFNMIADIAYAVPRPPHPAVLKEIDMTDAQRAAQKAGSEPGPEAAGPPGTADTAARA